ncbi:MAG: NAD(P)H-dependent oxidoreductase [Planctomycetales bacterium]|nr:NAD(P)H-dependent oxidoreductase [Planctomycetales bacterium]
MPLHSTLIESLRWRYATKRFDASKKIDAETWQQLQSSLVLTPSSYGLQPWKFLVITDEAVKSQLPAISWNQLQPKDCSHMVVFAARKTVDEEYINRFIQTVVSTRELPADAMNGYRDILVATTAKMESHLDWNSRQVYIALGQFMMAAALLQVDTCPMEGILPEKYDALLGLTDTEYTTVVACAAGYRHEADQQAAAKKVRFSDNELVVTI